MEFDLDEYKKRVKKNKQVVTVFMLTHNREKYVMLAIESALKQTYSNFSLIVLDNCSEDNTKQRILSINDSRIMYLYRESIIGDSNTEFAQKICNTDFFIILHDDDILEPYYLEKMVFEMKNSDYVAISSRCHLIDEKGVITKLGNNNNGRIQFDGDKYLLSFLKGYEDGFCYPSVIYRTSFYKDFVDFGGNSQVGPAGDQYIWLETERMGGKMCLLSEVLFRYRRHSNQESMKNASVMELQLFDYLIMDDFYESRISNYLKLYIHKIWNVNKGILVRYSKGGLSKKEYKLIFNRPSILYLKKKAIGVPVYYSMMFMCFFSDAISLILRRRNNAK